MLRRGFLDALPFAPSVLALGAIFGASSGSVGLAPLDAVLMSALVFSGAGQFAALPLWPQGGLIVILSTLALSLRFALITTSLAPLLASRPLWVRLAVAYMVTDENYALSVTRARSATFEPRYLVGTWLVLYGTWLIGTIVGVLVGAQVPSDWVGPLEQIFPLVFLVLTVLLCTSPRLALVACLGGVLSVVFALVLPNGWNVIAAGLLASLVGPLLDRRRVA